MSREDKKYSRIRYIYNFIIFWKNAGNAHHIHSPFLFNLYTKIINSPSSSDDILPAVAYRKKLVKDLSVIRYRSYGASARKERISTVSGIINHQAVSRKKGALLYRLVNHFKPAITIELGTNLGVGTVFIAVAYPQGRVYSIEGSRELLGRALQYIDFEKHSNIRLIEGEFHAQLPKILQETADINFAFIDGDHREQATLDYFELFCSKANNDTVLVLDDIHWSPGMERAWSTMTGDPRVTLAVDFFHWGMLFFRRELSKQFFCLRF